VPDGKRGPENIQREKRLVALYVRDKVTAGRTITNASLGPLAMVDEHDPDAVLLRKLRSGMRPRADLIILTPARAVIIEAKVRPYGKEIGQLLLYEGDFRATPEYAEWRDKPITLRVVSMVNSARVRSVCAKVGIEFELFAPQELVEQLRAFSGRELTRFQEGLYG
jgi:hypothetical protein